MPESDSIVAEKYSTEEITELFLQLDSATLTKMEKIANHMAYAYNITGEDLLHEAILSLLNGKRKLPRKGDFLCHIRMIIKSIRSNMLKKTNETVSLQSTDQNNIELQTKIPIIQQSVEDIVLLTQLKKDILSLFKIDSIEHELLEGKMDGLKRSELIEYLEITDNEYDTTWRRIRRYISKKYPEGLKYE